MNYENIYLQHFIHELPVFQYYINLFDSAMAFLRGGILRESLQQRVTV